MNESRYIRYDRRSLPKSRTSRPLFGTDSHSGLFFRCRICGFICRTDRDRTGAGVGYSAVDAILVTDLTNMSGKPRDNTLSLQIHSDPSLIEAYADGTPKVFKQNFTQIVTSGCPQCGSLNWK